MAFTSKPISLFFLLGIFLAMAGQTLAGRAMPPAHQEDGMKQPEVFIDKDGSVLIPGFGKILIPKLAHHHHLPIIPAHGGVGGFSGIGGVGAPITQIPGRDDTFVPNPGSEVPVPSHP